MGAAFHKNFWVVNTGNIALTIRVNAENPINVTAAWIDSEQTINVAQGAWFNLTLTPDLLTTGGSYSFSFVIA